MKDLNKRRIYALILAAISAIIVVALALAIVFAKRRDGAPPRPAKLTAVSVNGVSATADGGNFSVRVPQCATAIITYACEPAAECRFYTSDGSAVDTDNVSIGGKDVVLKYALGAGGVCGELALYNIIPDGDGLAITVNGVSPKRTDGVLVFELPPDTRELIFDKIELAEFFTYRLYIDKEKTAELTALSAVPIQPYFYLDVYNVNAPDVYRSYVINTAVTAAPPAVRVNGTAAVRSDDAYTVAVNKTAFLNIDVAAGDSARTEILRDGMPIADAAHIEIDEKIAEHTFTLCVISASGRTADYTLTVALIYDSDARIGRVGVNGMLCHADGNALYALLDRTDRLTVDIQTSSLLATAKLYSDFGLQNEIADIGNIDVRHVGTQLQFCLVVTAENGNTMRYALNVRFNPSDACALNALSVNGKPTVFESGAACVNVSGGDTAEISVADISVSGFATFAVYADAALKNEIEDCNRITVAAESPYVYIVVTAEDGLHSRTYCLELRFISDDNTLKSITVNGAEYVITGEDVSFDIESCDAIAVNGMVHAAASAIAVYYDAMQTEPVTDLSDIRYTDKTAELYVRIVAQSSDIRVYRIRLAIKDAPEAVFATGAVRLADWQQSVDVSSLVRISGNSYLPNQYTVTVYWNGAEQPSGYIRVPNEERIYALRVRITSPYFKPTDFDRQIKIEPYTLTPVTATLATDKIEYTAADATVGADALVNINCGSYVLGRHFYIAVYKPDKTEIITDSAQSVTLTTGTMSIGVCAVGDLFENYIVGNIAVTETVPAPPVVECADCYEYAPSGKALDVRDLFTVADNGNEILAVSVYIDGAAADALVLTDGIYSVRVTVLYGGGTTEKTFAVRVKSISDNTNAAIVINGAPIAPTDGDKYSLEIPYDGTVDISATTESAKATAALTVNGAAAEFGRVALESGENVLVVTVTAENGDRAEYTVTVTKRERMLPQILTYDKTVKLAENQAYVSVADCYALTANDYAVTAALYCEGNRLYGDVLPVTNQSKTYTVTVKTEGESTAAEATFRVGVIGYSAVKISFGFTTVACAEDYIFTADDFVESVTCIGCSAPRLELLLDGAPFADGPLAAGRYAVTVRAWNGDILLVEQTALFTVVHDNVERGIAIELTKTEIALAEETARLEFADVFKIDYGGYAADELEIYYIIGSRKSYELYVTAGVNVFEVAAVDAVTAEELYSQTFTLNCVYKPESQNVFSAVYINGAPVSIRGNTVTVVSDEPLATAQFAYELREGFWADGLLPQYALTHGANYIGYTAVRNGMRIECVLEIYNVCTLEKYISAIAYNGCVAENNVITAAGGGAFDPSGMTVAVSDSHVRTELSYSQIGTNVCDVTVRGRYGDIDIGYVVVRVFTGAEQPMLAEVLFGIYDASVVSYNINLFSADAVCVTDATELAPVLDATSDRYEIRGVFTGLRIGQNALTLTVTDVATGAQYTYALGLMLFPENVVSGVTYDGAPLTAENGVYTVDTDDFSDASIGYAFDERIAGVALNCESTRVMFNGAVVGYDYAVMYDRVRIYAFSVAVRSGNTAVTVSCGGAELAQMGNSKFVYGETADKSTQDGRIVRRFDITALYPYTTIAGADVERDGDGYYVTVDFGAVESLEQGAHTQTKAFAAVSLDGRFEYIISAELIVTQTSADDAPLAIVADGTQTIIFGESDLDGAFAVAGKPLRVSIFRSEITLTIKGYKMYNFVENSIAKDSITLPVVYFGYLEFDVEQDRTLKHVRIYCECVDADGNGIETGVVVEGKELCILENAPVTSAVYNGTRYDDVLVASGAIDLPVGTETVLVSLFGYLADADSFAFADGTVGRQGLVNIQDGKVLIIMDDYGTLVPYAVIQVNWI